MAYFNQERKKAMAPKIKEILKKYGLKGSLAVRHHSTVVLNIRSGEIDFITNFNECGRVKARDTLSLHDNCYCQCVHSGRHFGTWLTRRNPRPQTGQSVDMRRTVRQVGQTWFRLFMRPPA